jgi:FtsP/CotA-like multicopper oxidase with cupredoxin domain
MQSFLSLAFLMIFSFSSLGWAQGSCPRFATGSVVQDAPSLFSRDGKLIVDLNYEMQVDGDETRFCFKTPDGKQSPTLYLNPGDELILRVKNLVPADAPGLPAMKMSGSMEISPTAGSNSATCGARQMTSSSVNVHYHGTNTSPTCHSDEVIHTLINSGDSFTYDVKFPGNEPPGLYWYHPHVHGLSEAAVQGGATGLIVIAGFQNVQPLVAGLKQRLLAVRDYPLPEEESGAEDAPGWNVSLNYIPIPYPKYPPAVINMEGGKREFWRLANTSADTILDVGVSYDGVLQRLQVVGLDGVPTGSQDGTRRGKAINVNHIVIPPAGRAEFIVTAPSTSVKKAFFFTREYETGPDGDNDPPRPLALIRVREGHEREQLLTMPNSVGIAGPQRFEGLDKANVAAQRKLYFSENEADEFFITVDGQQPRVFNANNPPAITTKQGSVEEWTIENRTSETHSFHIHQIHFLLVAIKGVPVPPEKRQMLDMVNVPYWSGTGPYPSVTVRMDFRGPDIGDFVYHCHILEHEDKGMMAIIRVNPK